MIFLICELIYHVHKVIKRNNMSGVGIRMLLEEKAGNRWLLPVDCSALLAVDFGAGKSEDLSLVLLLRW